VPIRLALLVLTLAVCRDARAQEPSTTTTAPAVETPRPATEYGPETPRGAMARFLAAAREGHYARAAEYLNLRSLPSATRTVRGPELARQLEIVLDRALWVDVDRLNADPDGEPNDGLPGLRDSLGTIETATGPVEILIERVAQPGGPPVWKIAATTVTMIPALYEEFGWDRWRRSCPRRSSRCGSSRSDCGSGSRSCSSLRSRARLLPLRCSSRLAGWVLSRRPRRRSVRRRRRPPGWCSGSRSSRSASASRPRDAGETRRRRGGRRSPSASWLVLRISMSRRQPERRLSAGTRGPS
jgi:hypothetical protein